MSWKGQVALDGTLYFLFTTRKFSTGAPFTLAGTPALSVWEENNLTQITAGATITADYDSIAGLNQATIVASTANGYETGKRYDVVITTGTVDSVSVVGEVVGSFQVGPVSATVPDTQKVDVNTIKTQAVTCGAGVTVLASVGTAATSTAQTGDSYALANGATGFAAIDTVVDAIKVKTDYLPSATAGAAGGVFIAGNNAATSITTALTANITGNLSGSVDSVTTKTGFSLAADQSAVTVGTVTTVTNLTNAPTAGDLTATMKSSVTTAATSSTPALSAAGVDAILDEVVEGTLTLRQMLRIFKSALAGLSGGGGTATVTFRDVADAKARITATVDANGNRTAITVDGA